MADQNVKLVISAEDKTQQAFQSAGNGLKYLEGSLTKLSIQISAFSMAWQSVSAILQKGIQYIELGGKALKAEEAFKAMAESAEVNAGRLTAAMKKAADGFMDDSDLMQKATFAMAQGIDPDKMPQLLEAARVSARKTGAEFEQTVDGMVQAISTNMPRSLRQMGAITKEQMTLLNKAMAEGVTEVNLLDLVLANTAVTMAKLGPSANNAAKDLARFKVEVKELEETLGKGLIVGLQKLMGEFQGVAGFALGAAAGIFRMIQGYNELGAIAARKTGKTDKAAFYQAQADRWAFEASSADSAAFELYKKSEANMYGTAPAADTRTKAQKDKEIADANAKLKAADDKLKASMRDAAAAKKAEAALESWGKTSLGLDATIKKSGIDDELERKLIDINSKYDELMATANNLPANKKAAALGKVREARQAEVGDAEREKREKEAQESQAAAEKEWAIQREGAKALEELDKALSESKATELGKRLLAVDDAVGKEKGLADTAYESGIMGEDAYRAKIIEITDEATRQKGKINTEYANQTLEADTNNRLAALDLMEKEGTARRDLLQKRISLTGEALAREESYLSGMSKEGNLQAWDGQIKKVKELKAALADLQQSQKTLTLPGALTISLKQTGNDLMDLFSNVQGAVKSAFSGMTDALTDFVMTGKANFTDLANSIIRDMVRIMIQQQVTGPLAKEGENFIQNLFTTAAGGTGGTDISAGWSKGGYHKGGMATEPTFYRIMANPDFLGPLSGSLPRYHGGLGPNERYSVTTDDEMILTPGQQKRFAELAQSIGGGGVRANDYSPQVVNNYTTTVPLTINALDSRSVSQALAQHKDTIVGLVNQAYNKRGQRGPLGS